MKIIENMFWGFLNNKTILIIGPNYKGSPLIKFEYDVLIISEDQFKRYESNLIFEHEKMNIKRPEIFFI